MAAAGAVDGRPVKRRSGLGRGLDALLPGGDDRPEGGRALREVPLEAVKANPAQPRRRFDEGALAELADSIRMLGVLQPLLVQDRGDGTYHLVAGERRLRAAGLAGLETVPVVTVEDDGSSSLERALVENLHREDLNPIEEAAAYQGLLEERGFTQEELAERLGRSRSTIANAIRLLDLPDRVQALLVEGRLSGGHGRALLGLAGNPLLERVAIRAAHEGWSVRTTEEQVRKFQALSGDRQGAREDRPQPALAAHAQRVLSERLGTRVKVDIGARRGKIVIQFSDGEDLERLLRSLGADQDLNESK